MDLHYSQTLINIHRTFILFHYLMDLHYSQTCRNTSPAGIVFHYLMDLHYSQTLREKVTFKQSFTTLWIYTILKR